MKISNIKVANIKGVFVCILMLFVLNPSNIIAQENESPSTSVDIGILSKYVWRGYELSRSSIIIQPSATVSFKGFGFNLWGNLDTNYYPYGESDVANKNEFSETDLTLSYKRSFGPLTLGVGYIYYGLDGDDMEDLYLSVGIDILLAPTLIIYREVSILPQWYISFGISHSFELPKKMTLDLSGSISYNAVDEDGIVKFNSDLNPTADKYKSFHNGLISVGMIIPIADCFTLIPMVAYSFPLTEDAEYFIAGTNDGLGFSKDSDYFYGGVILSMSF